MIYNPTKIRELMDSVKKHLTIEEQLTVRELLENYNKLYALAREKIIYVKRKQEQFAKESSENDKLREENTKLIETNKKLKNINKEQSVYMTKLNQELKRYKKFFNEE